MRSLGVRAAAWRVAAKATFALLLSLACEGSVTEIIVVVDSELAVPEEVDRVEMLVTRQRDSRIVAEASVFLGAASATLPVTFSLEQKAGDPGPLTVDVQAKLRGQTVVFRRVRDVRFEEGAVMMLRMDVLAACRTAEECPPPPPLAAWQGPPAAWPEVPPPQSRDGGAPEAGGDSGPNMDALPLPDAALCMGECKQTCMNGEGCTTMCADDGDCSLSCTDDGTTCALESGAAKTTSLSCRKRARCTANVPTRAREGRVVCEDDAWCDMLCESPSCQLDCRKAQCRMRTGGATGTTVVTCSKSAECSMDFAAGADNSVVCNASTCTVTCRGDASCNVKCLGSATCLLACSTTGTCALTNCPKPQQNDCGGGVFVCGRACP